MNSQKIEFLNLRNIPARLRAEEVACLLGFQLREIPLLVSGGLLRPLGNPPVTGVKYFATVAIEECQRDPKWLAQASDRIVRYWQTMNEKRKNRNRTAKPKSIDPPADRQRRFCTAKPKGVGESVGETEMNT
jgi:hypothetical protein